MNQLDFTVFAQAVDAQIKRMLSRAESDPVLKRLMVADVDADLLWEKYLDAFPEGTNKMYRKRREYDCSCCRNFIRKMGNAIQLNAVGEISTIWDISIPQEPVFQQVANTLANIVRGAKVRGIFLCVERKVSAAESYESLAGGEIRTWNHFHTQLPVAYVAAVGTVTAVQNTYKENMLVFKRAMDEFTLEAVKDALDLIEGVGTAPIYRGKEFKPLVEVVQKHLVHYTHPAASGLEKDALLWGAVAAGGGESSALTHIRGSSIGELILDLSTGVDLEDAVIAYEAKVAPSNYKRTTAVVTPAMRDKCREVITGLDLMPALERRYATIHDITVNNVIYVDRASRPLMAGDVFDEIAVAPQRAEVVNSNLTEVTIDQFLTEVLIGAESVEVLVENQHVSNLVSLVSPKHADAKPLFRWNNNFSWSYNGDVTDSIEQRVKRAGGVIDAEFCARLAWSNTDDLDLHLGEPGGHHIYFSNKGPSPLGGRLDVDANSGYSGPLVPDPVENIYYKKLAEGDYTVGVHQYRQRSLENVGFEVELKILDKTYNFCYPQALATNRMVTVATFRYSHEGGVQIIESMEQSNASKTVWGVQTGQYRKVQSIMLSPNHWDNQQIGNKHYFFMLDGCVSDVPARGFYNEFLRDELQPHRKAMEVVGAKLGLAPADQQLSGLGFSSTKQNSVVCRVKGAVTRTVKVVF